MKHKTPDGIMKNGDKPAFRKHDSGFTDGSSGLTKREYFAAMAMQGMITAYHKINHTKKDLSFISVMSLEYADELLKQLES